MDKQGIPLVLSLILSLTCFLLVPCSSQRHDTDGPLTDDNYRYHQQLDDNYNLKWKFNSTHIQFQVKVKADGYVGFGISNHGDMYPGDMVIAWMAGETVHFHDRHAKSRVMPTIDDHQDWDLLAFQREDNQYNFTVVRKLNTCDEDGDIPIEKATTRVIYAYSDQVPNSDNAVPYHGTATRGTKSILLLDPPPMEDDGNNTPENGVFGYDLLNSNYSVPEKDTTYACLIVSLSDLQEKHHMIGYEPIIQRGHEKLVHHVVLYACLSPVPKNKTGVYYECYEQKQEEIEGNCESIWLAWGIGGLGFNYPPDVGHSLGTPQDPDYFIIETHYDNVDRRTDFVDNSGVRLFLTKNLRTHDAGLLTVGSAVTLEQIIPPKMPEFLSSGTCPSSCLEKAFGDGEIRIFGDFLHSHLIGKRMVTRHVRDGVELPPIVKDDHYDFNYQETRAITEERIVKKNDILITDCYYDSTDRDTVTYGGLSSKQEMCLSFILYYPRTNLTGCYTNVQYSKNGKPMYPNGMYKFLQTVDWSSAETREEFEQNVLVSDVIDFCEYGNEYDFKPGTRPLMFTEYIPEDVCERSEGPWTSIPTNGLVHFMCLVCLVLRTLARR